MSDAQYGMTPQRITTRRALDQERRKDLAESAEKLRKVSMPDGKPHMLKRLEAIKPGQRIMYYRGNFEPDMERCIHTQWTPGAPRYLALLKLLKDVPEQMERAGRVTLERREIPKSDRLGRLMVIEYVAVGR